MFHLLSLNNKKIQQLFSEMGKKTVGKKFKFKPRSLYFNICVHFGLKGSFRTKFWEFHIDLTLFFSFLVLDPVSFPVDVSDRETRVVGSDSCENKSEKFWS